MQLTRGPSGHLFLARGSEVELAASSPSDAPPPPDVFAQAQLVWSRELDKEPEDQRTKTMDISALESHETPRWVSSAGAVYGWQLLSIYRNLRWCAVGLAMIELPEAALAPLARPYIEAMCSAFVDAGDVTPTC
jgi:hypothetical protein